MVTRTPAAILPVHAGITKCAGQHDGRVQQTALATKICVSSSRHSQRCKTSTPRVWVGGGGGLQSMLNVLSRFRVSVSVALCVPGCRASQ